MDKDETIDTKPALLKRLRGMTTEYCIVEQQVAHGAVQDLSEIDQRSHLV